MDRDKAFEELKLRISDKYIILRSIIVEAIMIGIAKNFHADEHTWAIAGLLHDIDYEKTIGQPSKHGILGAEILSNLDVDEAIIYSVRAHNNYLNISRKRKMDKVLYLSDPMADLLIRSIATHPEGLTGLSTEYLMDKLNDKEFTSNVERGWLESCDELGFSLENFIDISLNAVKKSEYVDENIKGYFQ